MLMESVMFLGIALGLSVAVSRHESVDQRCAYGRSAMEKIVRLDALPFYLGRKLRQRLPDLVDIGGEFQETDEIRKPNLPMRRFIIGVRHKNGWVISYEHGPLRHIHSIGYYFTGNGDGEVRLDHSQNLIGPPCAAFAALVGGVRSSSDREM